MTTIQEPIPLALSDNARTVLERRYLARDAQGRVIETPEELFWRVASNIAEAERGYGADDAGVRATALRFHDLMASLRFLPNSPTLGNAGRPLQQLSACFVLPVEDSIEGIFESIKQTALIHKSGGGTGFAFSRLRPEGDLVATTAGVASGPVSFMKVFDAATEAIKQGGTRRGANMAILHVTHPDIERFITVKADMTTLTNFNISVAATDGFLQAVERGGDYELVNPHTGAVVGRRDARRIFRMLVENAWLNGDPGLVFIDRINASRSNPTPALGQIEATNPCGEQPLLPYESCNLGSINVARFALVDGTTRQIDWDGLGETVTLATRFLDDVIDMNRYPIAPIEEMTLKTRRIGLGVMGWADLLFALHIPYDSEEALRLAERLMAFIQEKADDASEALGAERGAFPAWEGSIYDPASAYAVPGAGRRFRNATRTTIAPTGTLSILAGCSGGIEPAFALAFTRQHFLDPQHPDRAVRMTEANAGFVEAARAEGWYSEGLMEALASGEPLAEQAGVPAWAKEVYVTAHDIAPAGHLKMQAAFQRVVDNAISKTINFPGEATVDDVAEAYLEAYREGCKGITIYRDGSRDQQVLLHVKETLGASVATASAHEPSRRRLPDERQSLTHKFRVGEQEGYITVGLYADGKPGEVFVKISKEGSTVSGLMDTVAMLTSYALQYGVPIETLAAKLRNTRFEPYGLTGNREIPTATSLVDYLFRWMELRFGPGDTDGSGVQLPLPTDSDGLGCPECGSILAYAEGCLVCRSCGYNRCG